MKNADFYADPANSVGYLTRMAFRSFSRALEQRTSLHGVSSGQWRFLRVLWQEDGLTQRELSRRVGLREPTTVIAVKSLEKSGFVRRKPSTEDRRRVNIFLTPRARALDKTLRPAIAEVNEIATAGLTAREITTLRKALKIVARNLAEDAEDSDTPRDSAV